jgi:hypothetical protein
MQQETDNQEDAMQLDTEDRFPSDDESMCNDPSDNETSGDDRRVSDDDSDIMESTDEETGSDTFANDITGLLSDESDDDTSSERREFGEDNDDDMLFTRLARWAQDIPRQKYIELKRMLESQGIFSPSLRRQSQRLAKLTGAIHRLLQG